ncbi:hypothetical protein [Cryobacterium psychrophilum]|uniref:Uncharacterized protein n=1 Tax=Cryobacterium psychrophilum TaxID=41988 RepID=A0A4Y8KPW4_9MICO|nr:hypothetical protein [Cryobacterium psychrophilum]TDW26909.1 hypothetical protein EDD25_3471 [Cryobacterium psychrophilum]TFD75317.1 hypothetical protein E3T53_16050 [Cryobacterium psychrophilum]
MAEPTAKDKAWIIFDRIIADASPNGVHTNPWRIVDDKRQYMPDIGTLERLLGVPLYLKATVRSGARALALDVWLAYELRRAGFEPDAVWPRASHPRILPVPITNLLDALPKAERTKLLQRLTKKGAISGVTSSSASILGKNYLKQVDVIMTDWATGPEILISTKRMDSSYGKNAANRIEESYGDAKNLRLRHPMAALGFLIALRSDILVKEPLIFEWLTDLVGKLGQEDDAYHATSLLLMDYGDDLVIDDEDDEEEPENPLVAAGPDPEADEDVEEVPPDEIEKALTELPRVVIQEELVEPHLRAATFIANIVNRALDGTPINLHKAARAMRKNATG